MARAAQAVSKNTTRQTLIDAAHALIWANSYAHVSVEDICREAGVQKGSFYHFFPTKNDLAAAALDDHWLECKPELDAIFEQNPTARAQLKALCREIYQEQKEGFERTGTVCGCPYATVAAELSNSSASLRARSVEISDHFASYFERLLKHAAGEGLIPTRGIKQRAHDMHVYVMGAMFHARITNDLSRMGKPMETALLRISGMEKP